MKTFNNNIPPHSLLSRTAGQVVDDLSGGVIKSKINRSEMGKFVREVKSNSTRWLDVLELYNTSKIVTRLIDKFSLKGLAELTGYSVSYISSVEGFHKRPSDKFKSALEKLNG